MRYSILLLALIVCGCVRVDDLEMKDVPVLPSDATEVTAEGNGWYSFKWRGQCFLTQQNGVSWTQSFDRVLTRIDCKESADES